MKRLGSWILGVVAVLFVAGAVTPAEGQVNIHLGGHRRHHRHHHYRHHGYRRGY